MKFLFLFLLFLNTVYAQATNALIYETSPYLTQHAHNPVNWYAWNEKTLQKAKDEHKPIFLSIGYSTCHWCHVMAKQSFENEKIARLLNNDYIAIKVDREELPHLDKYYQNVFALLKKRSGGWPLSAFLTQDAKVFYIATYIPPRKKYNIEGLDTLLPRLAKVYKNNKPELLKRADEIRDRMKSFDTQEYKSVKLDLKIINKTFRGLQKQYDDLYYGFSIQPKFPEASKISLLFDLDTLGVKGAKEMALNILRAMALHGIYDQVEGGFFRYSVDAAWEIPHFEKMLYTNAELIPLYIKAYTLTQDSLYKDVVIESIKMIEDRFEEKGVYLSASDADTNHKEGAYFVYSLEELNQSMKDLSKSEKESLQEDLDLSTIGNFTQEDEGAEDKIHINFHSSSRPKYFQKIRPSLKKIRSKRPYPFIDKKVNTAWNAMMIEALFKASAIDVNYTKLAEKRLESLLIKMYTKGILYHQSLSGKKPKQKALLEDYAFLISALIVGYAETYNKQYLFLAKVLSADVLKKFYNGKFWYLSDDKLKIHADMQDKYYKAPVNKMLLSLLKLASLNSQRSYLDIVQKSLKAKSYLLNEDPSYYPSALQVLLREKRGYITLKASSVNLKKSGPFIKEIKYPFVLTKAEEKLKAYLACDMFQCFSINKDLEKVIKIIEKR
ncbi:MAG: thioredoxin domain-containing protein [Arcobacter sp.]|nr:MAG: thioredoxin domain-containing protein [Arcobacter sp.]